MGPQPCTPLQNCLYNMSFLETAATNIGCELARKICIRVDSNWSMLLKPQLPGRGIVWETPWMLTNKCHKAERMEWFIEDQAFLRSYDSAPCPPPPPSVNCISLSVFLCVVSPAYWREGGGWRRGRAWSRIIRTQKSLGFYKAFNPLCPKGLLNNCCKVNHSLVVGVPLTSACSTCQREKV